MSELVLLPTLDRLGPYDGKGMAFGLTLQAALGAGVGFDRQRHATFLQPWKWKQPPREARVMLVDDEGRLLEEEPETVDLKGFAEAQKLIEKRRGSHEAWHKQLRASFDSSAKGKTRWSWSGAGGFVELQEGNTYWPAFLGELSLLPWPLPQSLGLSFFFKTRKLGAARLVVAPVLPAGFLGEGWPELWPIPCGQDAPEIVRIEYFRFADAEAGAGTASDGERPVTALHSDPEIVAQAKPIPLAAQQGCFFDLGTLWVKKPGKETHVFRDDWRSAVEDRLAEGLHLLPVFVQKLSQARGKEKEIQDVLPAVAVQGLAMLADIHGPGVRGGAPGGSLLSHAAQELRVKQPISDEDVAKLASTMADDFYGDGRYDFGSRAVAAEDSRLLAWAGRVDFVLGDRGHAKDLLKRPGTFTIEEVFSRLLSLEADLAAGDRAADLYVQHWRDFKPSSLPRGAGELLEHLQQSRPSAHVLRRQLLWDHLGLTWKDLRKSFNKQLDAQDDPSKLRAALRPDLLGFMIKPGRLGMPSGSLAFLKEEAGKHVDLLLDRVFPEPAIRKDAQPRRTRGLTVQVDTIACDLGDGSDFLERIQGVGLLMRRSGPGKPKPWLPLNVGRACLPGGSRETPAVLGDRVLVPTRLAYLNGLRDAMVTYDNEPLGIESPIASALADALVENEKSKDPAVRFIESDARVPALAYGATYEILPFLVANNGAVPSALASAGLPWGGTKEVADSDLGDAKKEIRTVVYKRLTPVGPLRVGLVEDAPGKRPPFELPAVPEGVALRARDLPLASWLPGDPELARKDRPSGDSLSHQLPCLFLASKALADAAPVRVASSFRFGVRPPAVDLQTWDRFLALDFSPDGKEDPRRQRVWESVHGLNLKNLERGPEDALDASLDDPAVVGLDAELWEMVPGNPAPQPIMSTQVPWPALPDREGAPVDCESLLREQRGLAPVEIGVADQAGLVPLSPGLRVQVREGRLYRLTLRARLDPQTRPRFETGIEDAASTSPWHLAIEVAEPFLEEKERPVLERWLWERLIPDRQAASSGRLRVTLGGWKDDSRFARQAFQAELRHQAWGWRGRPLASPHPDLEAGTVTGTLDARAEQNRYLAWELANLGDRREFECRRAAMLRRTGSDQPGIPSDFVFDEPLETGGILDPRAGHHRFGVHVISRYTPILPVGQGRVEARDTGDSGSLWRSLFVPCRFRGEVPAPKVRLILPLTDHQPLQEGDVERGGAPGWLVVLDEEWFAVGGLAESLEVEVLGALSPSVAWTDGKPPEPGSCPTGKGEEDYCYHQLGPDPIVTGKGVLELIKPAPTATKYRALDAALYAVEFDAVHGPVGHHRDFTDTTPHILASSFVIRPPRISDRNTGQTLQAEDVGYWLYQIRLRRSLRIGGRAEPLLSEPTAPFWVQLLPAISRVEEEWIGAGPLHGSLAADCRLEIEAAGAFRETDRKGFELYAVLTRQVFDVTGSRDQEAYLTVAGPLVKSGQSLIGRSAQAAPGSGSLKARLLEVQRHPDAPPLSDAAELWTKLFRIETPDRERGRIVRISRPFEVEAK